MILSDYIENQKMTGEHRLPPRSLLLPAGKRGIFHENFTDSDRIQCLNGTWKFKWLHDLPENEDFLLPDFAEEGYSDADWDDTPVPSMWQYLGYGRLWYTNCVYPFPTKPPYIDFENPVGQYRTTFRAKKGENVVLRFGAVGGAFFVWLNGRYVGFSKGSRIAAEFDVTTLIREGENTLSLRVFTWSDASYMEGQDMLLANGIIRDVCLVYEGKNRIWDYTALPKKNGLELFVDLFGGESITAELYSPDGSLAAKLENVRDNFFLPVENPLLWNAETPYLYELVMTLGNTVYSKRIGFRTTEVVGNLLLLNGKKITLKGINRHENNPKTGQAITKEQIRAELTEIKESGLNAIRTSHYTNAPVFFEIASELGIYVLDEADIETHGMHRAGDQGLLTKDPEWYCAYLDRISRMYYLNKNETCINIWSLNNESGDGRNFEEAAGWMRAQRIRKPLNFWPEGYTVNPPDFRVGWYFEPEWLDTEEPGVQPILILEYEHGMGNGPGSLYDIWKRIYKTPFCAGGYAWEYKSHSMVVEGRDGLPRYLYGEDFGEGENSHTFCLDGFHMADGTAAPGWDELKEIFKPVWVEREGDSLLFINTLDFTERQNIKVKYTVLPSGRTGEFEIEHLNPGEIVKMPFDFEGYGMNLVFTDDRGLDCDKQIIYGEIPSETIEAKTFEHKLSRNGFDGEISGDGFSFAIENGLLSGMKKDGKELLRGPMKFHIWRAPIDNDCDRVNDWNAKGIRYYKFTPENAEVTDGDIPTFAYTGKFTDKNGERGFNLCLKYSFPAAEKITVNVSGEPFGELPFDLPRIGLEVPLSEEFTDCRWFGRGPGDSYNDRNQWAKVGNWSAKISEMNFLYDYPQETGNREDCRSLTLFGGGLTLDARGKFSFTAKDFSTDNLTDATHCDELIRTGIKYLSLDCKMRGLGSAACGPNPCKEYLVYAEPFDFEITLY